MFKKYVLANLIESYLPDRLSRPGAYLLAEVQLNFLWLYLDFSAYSDVAVGVGRLIGVATPENFNRPFLRGTSSSSGSGGTSRSHCSSAGISSSRSR